MPAAREERIFVKICGITCAEDARAAVEAGADALGFVFWPGSPRYVAPRAAAAIAAELPPLVKRVGVFVDASPEDLRRTADEAGLEVLQLHGAEPPEAFARLPRPAWKALRVGPGFRTADAAAFAGAAAGVLVDTCRDGPPGGTGAAFDWSQVTGLRERLPFLLLAGGLDPDNVARAIAIVRPHGVDVSSGVESRPGRKDAAKLRAFVAAARSAAGRTEA
jgi:phosphoribosylanthranilate isomerase